jgi:hypothetical protein
MVLCATAMVIFKTFFDSGRCHVFLNKKMFLLVLDYQVVSLQHQLVLNSE